LSFLDSLPDRVPAGIRIGFPEATEARTAAALEILESAGRLRPVHILDRAGPGSGAEAGGSESEIVRTADRERRHSALSACPDLAPPGEGDGLRFAIALLAAGELDGVVAGAEATTAAVLRGGLNILGPASGIRTVSSAFYMVMPPAAGEPERVLTFTDAAVVPQPEPEQLAEIADSACRARELVVGDEPRVAFLSYATRDSAGGAAVERVAGGLELFRQRRPEIPADGPLQADAALVPEIALAKAPGSAVEGRANILVFPSLDAGNIAYKLVQRLGRARALGPILQGLSSPLNDLSRGATVEDIVEVAYITALLAG
jgi:phosphate acetyltransferase